VAVIIDVNEIPRNDIDQRSGAPRLTTRWRGVRQLIEDGALPSVIPGRLWGGRGRGESCAACGSPIATDECAFEVPAGAALVTLDRGCLNLWMTSISRSP
jgi:hypothetical protein